MGSCFLTRPASGARSPDGRPPVCSLADLPLVAACFLPRSQDRCGPAPSLVQRAARDHLTLANSPSVRRVADLNREGRAGRSVRKLTPEGPGESTELQDRLVEHIAAVLDHLGNRLDRYPCQVVAQEGEELAVAADAAEAGRGGLAAECACLDELQGGSPRRCGDNEIVQHRVT